MDFQSKVLFNESQYPLLTKHLASLSGKERAERIRALANAAYMIESNGWVIVAEGGKNVDCGNIPDEPATGFSTNFRDGAAL